MAQTAAEKSRRYRAAHPEKAREAARRYRERHPEKARQSARDSARKMYTVERNRRWQGLPEPTRECPENCECCGRGSWLELKEFSLDHDHKTGEFRGWLCGPCNRGIGLLGDTLDGAEKAVAYLKRVALGVA